MAKWQAGTHGGTYGGGNAVVLAAAKATLDVMLGEDLPGNAAVMGKHLTKGLKNLQKDYPVIGDVRGHGLMIATEFTDAEGQPDAVTTQAVHKACLEQNLLLLTCGSYGNVIRWIPPLVVTAAQIDEALAIFKTALEKSVKASVAAD